MYIIRFALSPPNNDEKTLATLTEAWETPNVLRISKGPFTKKGLGGRKKRPGRSSEKNEKPGVVERRERDRRVDRSSLSVFARASHPPTRRNPTRVSLFSLSPSPSVCRTQEEGEHPPACAEEREKREREKKRGPLLFFSVG